MGVYFASRGSGVRVPLAPPYLTWMPQPGTTTDGESFADVPASVADAAAEAVLCLEAGAPRGAILLARAAIEATAKDRGVTKGSLAQKIDQLHEGGHIRTYLRDGAYEVRYTGNDMAHGDFPDASRKPTPKCCCNSCARFCWRSTKIRPAARVSLAWPAMPARPGRIRTMSSPTGLRSRYDPPHNPEAA